MSAFSQPDGIAADATAGARSRGRDGMRRLLVTLLFSLLPALPAVLHAAVEATDDTDRTVRLDEPAGRIVGLAPHAVEILYAAGAGDALVGAVSYSDFPEAAKELPRLGAYNRLDLEAILALEPDLVVGWASGNPPGQLDRLRELGIPVYLTEPRGLRTIADDIQRLGHLAGSAETAQAAADRFRKEAAALTERYADRAIVPVFYQVWHQPLMTVDGEHLISQVIDHCGGRNIFQDLEGLAAPVTREAVLAEDPEAIIASGMGEARPEWLDQWRQWPELTAVQRGNLFFIPPSLVQRHGPRIIEGMRQLCEHLETARSRRP